MNEPMCPGCGAHEGEVHRRGCSLQPLAIRSCCHTTLWPDPHPSPHETWCVWGTQERVLPKPLGSDEPWRDLA